MMVTVRRLKKLIREAVEDAASPNAAAIRAAREAGLDDITTDREKRNGTTTFHDPVTADVYKISPEGGVRRYRPDWEHGPKMFGGHDKSAHSTRSAFQTQNPVRVSDPRDQSADPAAALARSVERRRANLDSRVKQRPDWQR